MLRRGGSSKQQKRRIQNQEGTRDGKRTRRDEEEEEEHNGFGLTATPSLTDAKKPRITFVLDKAGLKLGFVKKTMTILSAEKHSHFLLKQNKNLDDFRPDILHLALRAILDSPLNKHGMVNAIYVKVDNGVLFEVKPHTRIPRMRNHFCGVMKELLQKSCVTSDKQEKLLRVIQEPVTRHLPTNSRIIGLSHGSGKSVSLKNYVAAMGDDVNFVFVVGLKSHEKIDETYIDDFIPVARYPTCPSTIVGARVCDVFEDIHKII